MGKTIKFLIVFMGLMALGAYTPTTVVNVQDYGAIPDGVTDNHTAFANAIAALPNGGTLKVPRGTLAYVLASATVLPRNVIMQGEGVNSTTISCTSTNSACVVFADAAGGSLTTITNGGGLRDISLTGPGSGTPTGLFIGGDPGTNCNGSACALSGDFGDGGVFANIKISSFKNGVQFGNNAFLDIFNNPYIYSSTNDAILYPSGLTNSGENIKFFGGQFDQNLHFLEGDASDSIVFYSPSVDCFGASGCSSYIVGSQAYARIFDGHFESDYKTSANQDIVNTNGSACGNSALYFEGTEFLLDHASGSNDQTEMFKLNCALDQLTMTHITLSSSGVNVSEIVNLTASIANQLLNIQSVMGYNSTSTMPVWLNTNTLWPGLTIQPNNPNAPAGRGQWGIGMNPINSTTDVLQVGQLANTNNTVVIQRATDTTPSGNLLRCLNAAGNTNLCTVDVKGNATFTSSTANVVNSCKGDVTLSTGAGTFSNSCVTSASACNSKDITTSTNSCTVAAPGSGSVGITGTGSDVCRTWCE